MYYEREGGESEGGVRNREVGGVGERRKGERGRERGEEEKHRGEREADREGENLLIVNV